MRKQPACVKCGMTMHVAYIREGTNWRRIAWACPECGHVEPAITSAFRRYKKAGIEQSSQR